MLKAIIVKTTTGMRDNDAAATLAMKNPERPNKVS